MISCPKTDASTLSCFKTLQNPEEKIKFLASLVEQTSDVLTAADLHFNPITWNKAAENIYGLTSEQVIGKNLRDYIDIDYPGYTREEIRKSIKENGEWRGEMCFNRITDNKKVTLLINFKLLTDEYNNPLGYLVAGIDISQRKEAELKLRESENRFQEVADSAPVMIWMSDTNNQTMFASKLWIDFTGIDITTKTNIGWSDLVHPEDVKEAKRLFSEHFQKNLPVTIVYRLQSKEGDYRWVKDIATPRFLKDGSFIGYIGSVVDIHEQKLKEEFLQYQATILENVSDIIVLCDLEFRIQSLNKIAKEFYQLEGKDYLGKSFSEVIELNYQPGKKLDSIEFAANGIWKGEVCFKDNNSACRYLLNTVTYVCDPSGKKIGIMAVGRDITDRIKAEERLQKSELFYRNLIADSLDGMLITNEEGTITFVAPSIKNILGFETHELIDHNAFEFVHPEDHPLASDSFFREVHENPKIKFIVVRLLKKGGEWLWCMVRGHNLLRNSNINGIVIYFHDDSLRKKATDALKASEERFRNLVNDVNVGVVVHNAEGEIEVCNQQLAEFFERDMNDIIGKKIYDVIGTAIKEDGSIYAIEERPGYLAVKTKKAIKDFVLGLPSKTKGIRWMLVNANPVLDENGNIVHVICSVLDITERKKLEKDILESRISQQRLITQATIDGQEKERREIGKELHDNIGQQLTTTKLYLDLAKSTADDATNEMVSLALKSVADVINELRRMSRSLVPPTLGDLGLIECIDDLVDTIRFTQAIKIDFTHKDLEESELSDNKKLMLFRIVQEQLNNVVKHACATHIKMTLTQKSNKLKLTMKDDGNGFDVNNVKKGLGLMNMKNRAELFGGILTIQSAPGKGCILEVNIPLIPVQAVA